VARQTLTEDEVDQGRQRILQATARMTNKDGIGGLSMRALAAGLNLTTGALYPTTQSLTLETSSRNIFCNFESLRQRGQLHIED